MPQPRAAWQPSLASSPALSHLPPCSYSVQSFAFNSPTDRSPISNDYTFTTPE